jgi:hypothetical protein
MAFRHWKMLGGWLLLSALLLAGSTVWSHSREPRSGGKRISYWIRHVKIGVRVLGDQDGTFTVMLANLTDQQLACLAVSTNVRTIGHNTAMTRFFPPWPDRVDFWRETELASDPAGRAIRNMGPRALPYLRTGLRRRESVAEYLFCRWVWPRLPGHFQRWLGTPVHAVHLRANSAYALGLLGPAAAAAVPELQGVVQQDEDYLVRSVAHEALHRIDPDLTGSFYPQLFRQIPTPPGPSGARTNGNIFSPKLSL